MKKSIRYSYEEDIVCLSSAIYLGCTLEWVSKTALSSQCVYVKALKRGHNTMHNIIMPTQRGISRMWPVMARATQIPAKISAKLRQYLSLYHYHSENSMIYEIYWPDIISHTPGTRSYSQCTVNCMHILACMHALISFFLPCTIQRWWFYAKKN